MDEGSLLLSLQVWDGVSNRCISVFPKAHAGAEVRGWSECLCAFCWDRVL